MSLIPWFGSKTMTPRGSMTIRSPTTPRLVGMHLTTLATVTMTRTQVSSQTPMTSHLRNVIPTGHGLTKPAASPTPQEKDKKACVTPRTATIVKKLRSMKAGDGMYCWDPHAQNPSSDHPKGKACDITIGKLGKKPTGDKKSDGDAVADWLVKHRDKWGVKYVIWYGQIWTERTGKWRDYGGGGAYDPKDVTGGHFDHVHVSMH